uniref:Zf-CCHC domain-containing protein/UBN2_2 domain-containing protein n=1 Tax=Tanacetum cinerariifolium TaxID=118510 RepID=A0A6L2NVT5_TANCI|nr:zf-CCHC domain-containing protein/UBN2_2 domain-containing protein [Tanacetum cinerariifolium]
MHNMKKTVNELHAMLKLHEQSLPKNNAPALHAIRARKNKKLSQGASNSGIFTIELNTFLNRSWIYDTGYGTHICNTTQGLKASRKLKPGALILYMGNGQREVVKAIGHPKETMGYYFYYPPKNKIVVERHANFLEKDFILQKESGRIVELEDEDILPFENTSNHPIEEESLALIVSQEEDVIPVYRSIRTHKAPDRLCLNVKIDPD